MGRKIFVVSFLVSVFSLCGILGSSTEASYLGVTDWASGSGSNVDTTVTGELKLPGLGLVESGKYFFDDFEANTDEDFPAGWSTINPGDANWRVKWDGENKSLIEDSAGYIPDCSNLIVNGLTLGDVVVVSKIHVQKWGAQDESRCGVGAYINGEGEGYIATLHQSHPWEPWISDFKAIQMLNDGVGWGDDGGSDADQWGTGTWYYMKLKVEGNDQWEKVWRVGQPEPESWQRHQSWGGREPGSVGMRVMTGDKGGAYWFDDVAVYKINPIKIINVSSGWKVSLCDEEGNVKVTQTVADGASEVSLDVTNVTFPSTYQIKVFDAEGKRISLHSLSNIFGGDEYKWGGVGGYAALQESGVWTSNAIDSGIDANDWGSISWTGDIPSGTSIIFRTRTKNHEGDLWSGWSEYTQPEEITSPDGQYIQCQVELNTTVDSQTPVLREVRLTYYAEGVEAGVIAGKVKSGDKNLDGATVTALLSGIARGSAVTDADGMYTIGGLEPGTYKVTVAVSGYEIKAKDGVPVEAGKSTPCDFSLALLEGPFEFVPVYPVSESTPSRIMQGGKLFRYYRLVVYEGEQPVMGAVVELKDGSSVVTDGQGLIELAYEGEETKAIGVHQIEPVSQVKINGSEVAMTNLPRFSLEVVARDCRRKWELGGGINGAYAFIKGEAGGGTYIGLNSLSDEEDSTDTFLLGRGANLGIGVGVGVGWSAGVWKLNVDAGASADAKIIPVGEDHYTFEDPYSYEARAAQTAVLLDAFSVTRLIDTPVLGWLIDLLISEENENRIKGARDHWGVGVGAKASGHAGVGFGFQHLGIGPLNIWNISLPKADAELMTMIRHIGYDKFPAQPEVKTGTQVETFSNFDLDLLKVNVIALGDVLNVDELLFGEREGHFVEAKFMEEMFYDKDSKAVRFDLGVSRGDRSELTVFTVSDPSAMEEIAKESGGTMWEMFGWSLNPANLIVSNQQAMEDFANVLHSLAEVEAPVAYEQVREEISTSEFPVNLNFGAGANFGLGGNISYKKYYKFTKEEGAAQGGDLYKTAEYSRDEYLNSSDKDIVLLFLNILAGAGPMVVENLPIQSEFLDTLAGKWVEGVDGLASLYVEGTGLLEKGKAFLAQIPLVSSWVGAPAALSPARMVLAPGTEGSGVVGKIQLVNLYDAEGNIVEELDQDMELQLDYSQVDPSVDTSKLTVFHWDEENGCWQLMPSENVVSTRKVKAKIRSDGMYAMGADQVAPGIKFISPQDGDFASLQPTIEVELTDDFSTVDERTVRIELNGVEIVNRSNIAGYYTVESSRQLSCQVPVLDEGIVKPGENILYVEVKDALGNRAHQSIKFYVEAEKLDVKNVVTCPNPMHDATNFTWNASRRGTAEIKIYTLSGKLVKTIRDVDSKIGYNESPWDGKNDAGEEIASGIYIYVLKITDRDGKQQIVRDKFAVIE